MRVRPAPAPLFALLIALALAAPRPSSAIEVDTFREGAGGYFRVVVPPEELGGVPVERCVAVGATPNVPFVFALDSRSAEEEPVRRWGGHRRSAAEGRIQKEIDEVHRRQGELWSERHRLQEEIGFLDGLSARVHSGEVELSAADLERQAAKRAALGDRLSEMEKSEAELQRQVQELYRRIQELPKGELDRRVRLVVAGRVKGSGTVSFALRDRLTGALARECAFEMPAAPGGAVVARETWANVSERAWRDLAAATPGDSIYDYLLTHDANRRAGAGGPQGREGAPRAAVDLYSLASGALAIEEALQLDRMTAPIERGAATFPLAGLEAPKIASHPYAAMMKGREPETWPVERAVPEDCWYLHFASIERQFAFADLLDQWGTGFLHAMRANAADSGLKERILGQLCLEAGALSRLFGERAIADLALVGGDPLLIEGSDLAVILNLKNAALFDANRALRVAEAKRLRPDLAESRETVRGREVKVVATADRAFHAFSADLEGFRVIANSRPLLERILAAWDGEVASLGSAPDFRYLRTIFPARAEREDGFLYLSDAHIRKLVGPGWKIARARRLECGASLTAIANAVTLWRAEGGTGSPSVEALLAADALRPSYLSCPDGGAYHIDPATGEPTCSVHGARGRFAPIRELSVTRVHEGERKAYERFVKEYNAYWTRFFDPVAVRLRLDGGRLVAETCILPLVDNSAYEGLKRFSGGAPVAMAHPAAPGTIAEVLLKLDLPARAKEFDIERMILETPFTLEEISATFGDSIGFHVVDAPQRFTFDSAGGPMTQMILRETAGALAAGFTLAALVHPVYLSLPVRDEAAADRFAERLCAEAEGGTRRRRGGFLETLAETYTVETAGGRRIRSLSLTLFILKLRLHFVVRDGFLFVASDRALALDLAEGRATPLPAEGNLVFRVFFEAFRETARTWRIDWAERVRAACVGNLGSLRALALHRRADPGALASESRVALGFAPFCPAGGDYRYDATRECVFCTAHGAWGDARQPLEPEPGRPLQAFLDSLATLEVSLAMTPEGIMTRVDLRRR